MGGSPATTTDTYDLHGNLIQVDSPQGSIHYEFDPATGLKTRTWTGTDSSNPTTDIHYGYDPLGRLTAVNVQRLDGAAVVQDSVYTYNPDGSLHTTTLSNGTVETRSYDAIGRLLSVVTTHGTSTIASFTYDPGNGLRRSETDLDGRTETYTYDADGRLVEDAITGDPDAPDRTYTYSYDLAGNRVEMTDSGDGSGASDLTYTYDADGRLIEVSGTSDGSASDTTYTYDPAGNTKTVSDGTTDTWDLQGRLVKVQTGGHVVVYTYDADGVRTSETVDGATTSYLNDPTDAYDRVLEEYAPGGARLTYVRGLDLLFQDRADDPTEPVSYYVHDALGSTRALTDSTGDVTDTYVYDPYGSLIPNASHVVTTNAFLYAGLRLDDATGDYVTQSRIYDAAAGRFMSRDSYDGRPSDPITLNHYIYAGANPVNNFDPGGNDFSVAELSVANGIENIIHVGVGYINGLLRVQSAVNKLIDLYTFSRRAITFLRALQAGSTPAGAASILASQLRAEFGGVTTNQITAAFAEVAKTIGPDWTGISWQIRARAGDIARDAAAAIALQIPRYIQAESRGTLQFVLYLPTGPEPGRRGDKVINLGDRVAVAVSPKGGRLFGFGVRTAEQKAINLPGDQWFRIDYYDRNETPPLNVHYHVFGEQDHHPGPGRVIWTP